MWSTALCGRVKQPCCTWHQCLVIAIRGWTVNTIRCDSASCQYREDGSMRAGPTHPFEQDQHKWDSTLLFCLCHHGHVISLLQHSVFVNIVNTHRLAQWAKANYSLIMIDTAAHLGAQTFCSKCDFNLSQRPLLCVHLHVNLLQPLTKVHMLRPGPVYSACCAIREHTPTNRKHVM